MRSCTSKSVQGLPAVSPVPQGANQLPYHPQDQRGRSEDRDAKGNVSWTNFQFHHTPHTTLTGSRDYTLLLRMDLLTIKAAPLRTKT
jgi:hypothetical protein